MPVLSLPSKFRLHKLEENMLLIGIYKDLSWKKVLIFIVWSKKLFFKSDCIVVLVLLYLVLYILSTVKLHTDTEWAIESVHINEVSGWTN